MNIRDNTILLTGGSSGIGLALAKAFCANGNTVIAAARDADKLASARASCPGLHTVSADICDEQARQQLIAQVLTEFPRLNMLVNNAAAGFFLDLQADADASARARLEMETNYLAPMHLVELLLPHLGEQATAAIVNISTIGVYLPIAAMPGYSASKAAMHSYSQSLRWQLAGSNTAVFEVIPPAVDTEFVAKFNMPKTTPEHVAEQVLKGLSKNHTEIAIGAARPLRWLSRLAPKTMERASHAQTAKALGKQ